MGNHGLLITNVGMHLQHRCVPMRSKTAVTVDLQGKILLAQQFVPHITARPTSPLRLIVIEHVLQQIGAVWRDTILVFLQVNLIEHAHKHTLRMLGLRKQRRHRQRQLWVAVRGYGNKNGGGG